MTIMEAIEKYTYVTNPVLQKQFGKSAYMYMNGDDQYLAFRYNSRQMLTCTTFPLEIVTTNDWTWITPHFIKEPFITNFEMDFNEILNILESDFFSGNSDKLPKGLSKKNINLGSGTWGNRHIWAAIAFNDGEIPEDAFYGCTNLRSVLIPKGTTKIGMGAFQYCTKLKDINVPEGVTEIGSGTFVGCHDLKNIELPESLSTLGQQAFQECRKLKSIVIPKKVNKIKWFTFAGCINLEDVTLKGTKSIDEQAFWKCRKLDTRFLNTSI